MPALTPQNAALVAEYQRRQGILKDLNLWAKCCGLEPAAHHRYVNDKLAQVEQGKIKRLALFLPPGSAKSSYASVLFPPHFLAKRPRSAVLATSHSTELAESFGRRCRNIIESHETELGYTLCEHSRSAGRWETSNGGNYFCAGVGTAIAGYRADLGLIDDPLRNKEDADSKLIRDKQWDWYNFDFKPRLKPDAAVVLIQTRWHEDDLAGRILANEKEQWEVVRIPFFAEDNDPLERVKGTMLWPEWFKADMFPKDSRVANALYQNNPTPESGDYFKADWLVEYKSPDLVPKNLRHYCASDHAFSERATADPSLFVPFGIDQNDNIWILAGYYWGKCDTLAAVEKMLDIAAEHKPLEWFLSKEHIVGAMGPFLRKRMFERGVYFPIKESVAKRDKSVRCRSIQAKIEQRRVFFPAYVNDWHNIKHEILNFPAGTHDEWPDVLGEIGRALDSMTRGDRNDEDGAHDFNAALAKPWHPTLGWLKEQDALQRQYQESRYGDR